MKDLHLLCGDMYLFFTCLTCILVFILLVFWELLKLHIVFLLSQEDWVLCRVFHKGKEEMNSTMKLSHDHLMLETTISCTAPLTISPPTHNDQNMHCGYSNQITSFSTTPPNQSHSHSHSHSHNNHSNSLLNLLQLSQEKYTDSITEISSKNDDYGFLWDMNLEESGFENGTLDDIRFELENSMVVLWIKKHAYAINTPY